MSSANEDAIDASDGENSMRHLTIMFAAALLMPVTAALADPQAPPAQPAPAAAPASEKLICKQEVHEGLIVRTNTCRTAAEWENMRRSQQRDFSNFQNRSMQTSGH
jgi:hypothetical protein